MLVGALFEDWLARLETRTLIGSLNLTFLKTVPRAHIIDTIFTAAGVFFFDHFGIAGDREDDVVFLVDGSY